MSCFDGYKAHIHNINIHISIQFVTPFSMEALPGAISDSVPLLYASFRNIHIYISIPGVTPFSMKALIGAISDSVPLFGYHKASYIMASAVLGSVSYIVLGSVDLSAKVVAFLFFMVNIELATSDLLCEGKYAELMRAKPG